MEAQGIEPWSEPASGTASTCVGRCFRVAPGRSSANLPETNLPTSYRSPRRRTSSQSGFAIRRLRPGRAPSPKVREASKLSFLRSQRQIRIGSWNFSKRFSQGPGPGHAATPSTDPSKPVAPLRVTSRTHPNGPANGQQVWHKFAARLADRADLLSPYE